MPPIGVNNKLLNEFEMKKIFAYAVCMVLSLFPVEDVIDILVINQLNIMNRFDQFFSL